VKTKWAILGLLGLGAIAVGSYFAGSADAQNNAQPNVMGRTRIGFVNLHEVLKHYQKWVQLRDNLKAQDEQYVNTLKVKQARLEQLATEAKDPKTTPARKEAIEREAKQIQFDMQILNEEAKKKFTAFRDENMAQIYREVDQVVKEYAKANGLDIVMRYNEDWGDDYHSPAKVVGRMQYTFFPMYYDQSLEITAAVRDTLNKRYASAANSTGVVPASTTGGAGTPGGAGKK
jgi:Skp family chaperone for outer membrane proteins